VAYISFQPNDHFNNVLYTGNNSANAITGVGFQPDWLWLKPRNYADHHRLMDVLRGQNTIYSNRDVAQDANSSHFTSLDSDGFTLAGNDGGWNSGSYNYVAWNWKAGGSGSSNTDGSINTTATSVNTTSGFSISTYTGTGSNATVGHGLGVVPKMVMIKRINATGDWRVYTEMTGNQSQLSLSQNSQADSSNTAMWNSTSPTTTTFSIGTHANVNASGGTYVAYCFAQTKGFSRINQYKGNGSTSGVYVHCGFSPALVILKRTDADANWVMSGNKFSFNGRGTHDSYVMFPSTNAAETDSYGLLLHSNGFSFKGSDSASATVNGSGGNYIYMAFAANSIVSSNGVPATAR
jgi:hypothetical protein